MRAKQMIGQVQENTRDYEKKLRSVEFELSGASEKLAKLAHREAVLFTRMAQIHLNGNLILDEQVIRQLELRVEEEMAKRKALGGVEADIARYSKDREGLSLKIEQAHAQGAEALAKDATYRTLSEHLDGLEAVQAEQAADDKKSMEEIDAKLPGYHGDMNYSYLVAEGYGTPEYRGGRIRKFLDGWLAKRCNFAVNRANELMLREMREALKIAAQTRATMREPLQKQLNAIRKRSLEESGETALRQGRDSLTDAIKALKREASELQAELQLYAEGRDARMQRIQEMSSDILRGMLLSDLERLVEETPDAEDDAIVREIRELKDKRAVQAGHVQDLQGQRSKARHDYERAKRLERELDDSNFTSSRYEYRSGLDVGDLLTGYMAGTLTSDSVASEVRSQRRTVEDSYSSSLSSSSSSSSWSGSSSSFGGGGFSSSDSSGGGSFSTSDGF